MLVCSARDNIVLAKDASVWVINDLSARAIWAYRGAVQELQPSYHSRKAQLNPPSQPGIAEQDERKGTSTGASHMIMGDGAGLWRYYYVRAWNMSGVSQVRPAVALLQAQRHCYLVGSRSCSFVRTKNARDLVFLTS